MGSLTQRFMLALEGILDEVRGRELLATTDRRSFRG